MHPDIKQNIEIKCPEYQGCVARRVEDAKERGMVIQKLTDIDKTFGDFKETMKALQLDIQARRLADESDMRKLYLKVGGISGVITALGIFISKIHF